MKVLLAMDRSSYSKAAARFLQWFRLPLETDLTILQVINTPLDDQAPLLMKFPWYKKALAAQRKENRVRAQKFVNRLQKPLQAGKKNIRPVIREGPPGKNIVKTIKKYRIDLAVLGSRGFSGVRRFLLGSVSEWVLNAAPCSVLIVRGKKQGTGTSKSARGIKIIVATDGSPDAQAAMTFLHALGLPSSSKVTALHVSEPLEEEMPHLETSVGLMGSWTDFIQSPEEIRQAQEQTSTAVLKEAQRRLSRPGLKVNGIFSRGHVADEIIQTAKQLGVDLVVLGSKGLTAHKQFLLGEVSQKVVRYASCSVLVVRKQMGPETT